MTLPARQARDLAMPIDLTMDRRWPAVPSRSMCPTPWRTWMCRAETGEVIEVCLLRRGSEVRVKQRRRNVYTNKY